MLYVFPLPWFQSPPFFLIYQFPFSLRKNQTNELSLNQLRSLIGLHRVLSFLAPAIGLITSIVATALQYHINQTSSSSTLQTWACQWQSVSMSSPNFNVICKETRVALYMTVTLIPLEVVILGLVGTKIVLAKKASNMNAIERKG